MSAPQKKSSALQFALLFIALYLGIQLLMGIFFPQQPNQAQPAPGPVLTSSSSFTLGNHPVLHLRNRPAHTESMGVGGWIQSKLCTVRRLVSDTPSAAECAEMAVRHQGTPYVLPARCPQPPVDVLIMDSATGNPVPAASSDTVQPCGDTLTVMPGETVDLSMGPWKYSLFDKAGTYEVRLPESSAVAPATVSGAVVSTPMVARFEIVEPGLFTKLFRTFISAPFLNALIFIASVAPGHNLGIAIIILTLIVKLLLFFPTQHALEGQKKMQMLQPKIEAIKAKHPGDSAKIQEETMKLWKEYKINPFQSCLPMLIQFPVLIGLFYVIRDGSDLTLSRHLIYGPYQDLPWHFGTSFLGLNLLKPEIFLMPILLVALQFVQMKLTFSIQKRKNRKKEDVIDVPVAGKEKEKQPASPQDMQQKMMLYVLPLMIGFFALKFPAAVSLYWGVSTLFAIGQQIIVNREHLRV